MDNKYLLVIACTLVICTNQSFIWEKLTSYIPNQDTTTQIEIREPRSVLPEDKSKDSPNLEEPSDTKVPSIDPEEQADIPLKNPSEQAQPKALCTVRKASTLAKKFGITHYEYQQIDESKLVNIDNFRLTQAAANAYNQMREAAQTEGIELVIISTYRSIAEQEVNFTSKLQGRSLPAVLKSNSPVVRNSNGQLIGHSEHHTGYAIDVLGRNYTTLTAGFSQSTEGRWLSNNVLRFGFEISFTKDNVFNVAFEPWHIRFIGDKESQRIFCYSRSQSKQASL
jgi:zinc D-Ala-D-Ala carboxypeptidase